MQNNMQYHDLESRSDSPLLDELMRSAILIRNREGIDCERHSDTLLEKARQFMPLYVAKIVMNGMFKGMAGKESFHEISLEHELQKCSRRARMEKLIGCADDNVTLSVIIKYHDKGYSSEDIEEIAVGQYNRAANLKKVIIGRDTAGSKLAYIADNMIGAYDGIIRKVFMDFSASSRKLDDTSLLMKEIDEITPETEARLETRIEAYIVLRGKYTESLDIRNRLAIKSRLKGLYDSIKKDRPAFRDDELFPEENT